ncbi:UNVERIFIED_CONTAM: hypothetical protein FKN15_057248 [Acipenser sinensis]
MDRNALAELLQALESRRDAEERRREERYTALIERLLGLPGMFWNDSQIALITVAPAVVLIISAAIIIKMKYWKNNGELKGTTVTVQSDGSTAVLNKDFTFRCSLSDPKVKQVTWQKQKDKALENVATYSVTFGAKVLEPYHQRVNFSLLGLNESSITIHNVQPEDEGCYMCLFNTYPQGSITGRSCFTVLGISEINIETISTESENTAVVSCSATGKPAPKIRWNASESVTSNAVQSSIDRNGNGIVTVTSNLTLDLSSFLAEEISCFVSHSTLNQEIEKNITIREDKRTLTNQVHSPGVVVFAILCIAALIIVTVACFVIRRKKKTKEIYEPHLEVESISKPESGHEEVKSITCSVTGKPAASISWNATEDVLMNPQQYSVVNPNGTITLIYNATVLPSRISNKEVVVTCKVTHPGLTREKQTSRVISGKY